MRFKDLKIGANFTMLDGTAFSIGRRFRKISARRYVQLDKLGQINGPVYKIGTVSVEVREV